MNPLEDLYKEYRQNGWITQGVTLSQFSSKFDTPETAEMIYDDYKAHSGKNIDKSYFMETYVKKKPAPQDGGASQGLSNSTGGAQPSQDGGLSSGLSGTQDSIFFDKSIGVAQDGTTSARVNSVERVDPTTFLNLTGDEDPVMWGEQYKSVMEGDSYGAGVRYAQRNQLRGDTRKVENAVKYGEIANKQVGYYDGQMKMVFGDNWQNKLQSLTAELNQTTFNNRKEQISDEINQITSHPFYQKIEQGIKASNRGQEVYNQTANAPTIRALKQMKAEAQAEADKNYEAGGLRPKANFMARKTMNFLAGALTLPRTAVLSIPGSAVSNFTEPVTDLLANWGDDMLAMSEAGIPKPTQLQAGIFEDIAEFKGEKVVVNDGKPVAIINKEGKRRKPDMAFTKDFTQNFDGEKSMKFSGSAPLLDQVAESAADLLIMRYVGGGTKLGTSVSSIALTHSGLYNEAAAAGMSADDAAAYAATGSIVNAALEAHFGNIEGSLFKGAALEARKKITSQAVLEIAKGLSAEQAAWKAVKTVFKETTGEVKEEVAQSFAGDINRAVWSSETAKLKMETDAKNLSGTVLATTLLTAPLAAFGLKGYKTKSRQSSLMAAIENQQGFETAVMSLVETGDLTQETAAKQLEKLQKLREYKANLPDGMTFEQQTSAMAVQEYLMDNAPNENLLPAQQQAQKESTKAAEEELTATLTSVANEPVAAVTGDVVTDPVVNSNIEPTTPTVQRQTIQDVRNETTTGDIDADTPVQADKTKEIADAVVERIAQLGGDPEQVNRTKLETEVANNLYNTAYNQDQDMAIDDVIEDIAVRSTATDTPKPVTSTWDYMDAFVATGERLSTTEQSSRPDHKPTWFGRGGQSVNDVANDVSRQLNIPFVEAKAQVEQYISENKDKVAMGNPAIREAFPDVPMNTVIEAVNSTPSPEITDEQFNQIQSQYPTPEAAAAAMDENGNIPYVDQNGVSQQIEIGSTIEAASQAVEGSVQGQADSQAEGGNVSDGQTRPENSDSAQESLRIEAPRSDASVAASLDQGGSPAAAISKADPEVPLSPKPTEPTTMTAEIELQATAAAVRDTGGWFFEDNGKTIVVGNMTAEIADLYGGVLKPGVGWIFQDSKVLADASTLQQKTPSKTATAAAGTNRALVYSLLLDPISNLVSKVRKVRIRNAANASEALDILSREFGPDQTGQRSMEILSKSFPGITVVTDTDIIDSFSFPGGRPASFIVDGVVYVDYRRVGPDTVMHEIGHIWAMVAKVERPDLYNSFAEAVKSSEYMDAVKSDPRYSNNAEGLMIEEAISTSIGERGARIMNQTRWNRFAQALADLRDYVKYKFGKDTIAMTVSDFADNAVYEIMSKKSDVTSRYVARIQEGITRFQYGPKDALDDLDIASKMYNDGQSNEKIQAVTGFRVNEMGKWEFVPIQSDISQDISTAISGDQISLDALIFSEELYTSMPSLKNLQVVFSDTITSPTLASNKDGVFILMPIKANKDAVSNKVREIVMSVAKISEGMALDFPFATTIDLNTPYNPIDVKTTVSKMVQKYRDILAARETGSTEARKAPAIDYATAVAMGLPTPADQDAARYDRNRDAMRKAAIREAARSIIEKAVLEGTDQSVIAPRLRDQFELDVNWVTDEFNRAKSRKDGARSIKAKQAKELFKKKIKDWMTKQFSYKGLLPKDIFELNRRRQGEVNALLSEMDTHIKNLETLLSKEDESMRKQCDLALKGEIEMDVIPTEIAAELTKMRAVVDRLSYRMLKSGGLTKSATLSIMENLNLDIYDDTGEIVEDMDIMAGILSKPPFERTDDENDMVDDFIKTNADRFGRYLNRSYRVHTFPDWKERIPAQVMANAKAYIQRNLIERAEEIEQGMMEAIADYDTNTAAISNEIKEIEDRLADPANQFAQEDVDKMNERIDKLNTDRFKIDKKKVYIEERAIFELESLHGRIKNIDGEINRVLDYKDSLNPVSNKGTMGATDRAILKQRKDLAPEIRALLGEFEDPIVNFSNSIAKMAHLTANQEFLNSMRKRYEGVYFFEQAGTNNENWKQFGSEGNANLAPLSGWYTTPEIFDAMTDYYSKPNMDGWHKFFIANVVTPIKLGKTVLSPETHPRNFFGNVMFHVVHGWTPGPAKAAVVDYKNKGKNDNWQRRKELYYRLGILGESVTANDLSEMMTDIENRYTIKGMERLNPVLMPVQEAAMWVYNGAKKAYEAEDDIHRVVAFENETVKYARAWYGTDAANLSAEQLSSVQEKAAQVVSMIMPTASFVPRMLKTIRRFPFTGTFVTFPAEMLRTTYNTIALGREEMKDKRTIGMGIRRLAGLATATAGLQAVGIALKSLFDYEDDYWKAVNDFLPSYKRNSQILPVAESDKGYPKYFDIGYTNPFAFVNKSMNALVYAETPVGGLSDAMLTYVEPFMSPELTFNTLVHASIGKDDRYKDILVPSLKDPVFRSKWLHPENIEREFAYVARKLRPGIAKSANDAYDIAMDRPDESGRVKSWEAFLLAHLVGLRVETFDPIVSAKSKTFELKDSKAKSRAIFGDEQNLLNRGWERLNSAEIAATPEQLATFDKNAQESLAKKYETTCIAYRNTIEDAHKFYKNCLLVGISDANVVEMLKDAGFSVKNGEVAAIISGNFSTLQPDFKKKEKY
jgi:hypothetical protein